IERINCYCGCFCVGTYCSVVCIGMVWSVLHPRQHFVHLNGGNVCLWRCTTYCFIHHQCTWQTALTPLPTAGIGHGSRHGTDPILTDSYLCWHRVDWSGVGGTHAKSLGAWWLIRRRTRVHAMNAQQ